MAVDVKPRALGAELQARRRFHRDMPKASATADKKSIRARLEAMLAELKREEGAHGNA